MTLRRAGGSGAPLDFLTATYQPWPLGARGLYTTDVDFAEPGAYFLDIDFEDRDGVLRRVGIEVDVPQRTRAPDIGEPAPPSETKTLAQAGSFDDLTTGSLHDADLYQVTLAEAVSNDLPTVVVFASPAFCINAVCGPSSRGAARAEGRACRRGELRPRRLLRQPKRDAGRHQHGAPLARGDRVGPAGDRVDVRDRPRGARVPPL